MAFDFFSAQAEARKKSFWLLVVFFCLTFAVSALTALSVLFILNPAVPLARSMMKPLFNLPSIFSISVIVFCIIAFGAWTKSRRLKKIGVHGLLQEAGANRIPSHGANHFETRFRNVAQEMAIACGLPVPALYIIPNDPSINAFAAGNSPNDACIVVTSGALHCLSRAELQGVVAHEFSHILNSDVALNMELISILHGYTVISSLGRNAMRARKGHKAAGLALFLCGLIGLWISTLVKAFFSRQREWLADASAVQFTRNPVGLRGALEKIDSNQHATVTKLSNADSFSHMFFVPGVKSFFEQLLSTHPPIAKRIRALGRPSYLSPKVKKELPSVSAEEWNGVSMGIANNAKNANNESTTNNGNIASDEKNVIFNSLEKSERLIANIPHELREACSVPHNAVALSVAILIHSGSSTKENAIEFLKQKKLFSQSFIEYMKNTIFPQVSTLSLLEATTLLTLACTTLRAAENAQKNELVQHAHAIITSDKTTTLTEISVFLTLCSLILENSRLQAMGLQGKADANQDVTSLIAFVAHIGSEGSFSEAQKAYNTALSALHFSSRDIPHLSEIGADALLRAVGHIRGASVNNRKRIVHAIADCITADRRVLRTEREIFRAICTALEYPMPL
jgi:Zn-dependent protease with chaperone function